MSQYSKLPLECFIENTTYGLILSYPIYKASEVCQRVAEMICLGVHAVELVGEKHVYEMPILGKGCVGIVVKAYTDAGEVALKVRRLDADRGSMLREAEAIRRVNSLNIGPRLQGASANFIVMEYIQGKLLPVWVETLKGRGKVARLRKVLRMILEDCFKLDMAGIDHGELSFAPKHIIIEATDRPRIIDFETASFTRRPSNVTSISQYLFIGSKTAKNIRRILGKIDDTALIKVLKAYKNDKSRESFQRIITISQLKP